MDGFGDGANGTVSIRIPGKKLNEISRSSNCNIGRMYRYATLLLGMRPAEHEYKLMGLAAYNTHKYGKNAYNVYAETLQVDSHSVALASVGAGQTTDQGQHESKEREHHFASRQ